MPNAERIEQLRARLISLRGQRKRLASRAVDLERRSSTAVANAREELDAARSALNAVHAELAERRAQVDDFERSTDVPFRELTDWHRKSRAAAEALRRAQERRVELEARAAEADARLALTIRRQEEATTEQARIGMALEREIERLQREISDLQAAMPLPESPDPQFRDALSGRLRLLEDERGWVQEEIAMREERLRRLAAEAAQIRSLLELHSPEWGRDFFLQRPAEAFGDRTAPAWRSAVVEMLTQAGEPMHYREIAAALTKSGQGLGGQDPAETLLAALSRDTGFVRPARGLYWLADRPLPRDWSARVGGRADRRTREERQRGRG
ncbi:MAG: hypothetical protein JO198_12790 [Candidatus Dormibacteraeota bacterium]|nr:hypothetical protein [Candidatus Dormibacteraeota bacterium]